MGDEALRRDAGPAELLLETEPEGDPTPELSEALTALARLYSEANEPDKLTAVDERRLELAGGDPKKAIEILFELGITAENDFKDAKRAFGHFRRAHELVAHEAGGGPKARGPRP